MVLRSVDHCVDQSQSRRPGSFLRIPQPSRGAKDTMVVLAGPTNHRLVVGAVPTPADLGRQASPRRVPLQAGASTPTSRTVVVFVTLHPTTSSAGRFEPPTASTLLTTERRVEKSNHGTQEFDHIMTFSSRHSTSCRTPTRPRKKPTNHISQSKTPMSQPPMTRWTF